MTLEKLPEMCAARNPSDGKPILIKRGVKGYFPVNNNLDVDGFNARGGVTAAQVEAMTAGSMFGWDCPAADPDTY
jgi:hypothetical protein